MTEYDMENRFSGIKMKPSASIKDTFRLTILGDSNDGDYEREVTTFKDYEELSLFLTFISKIGKEITSIGDLKSDDYKLSDDENDMVYEICPYNEYGMHSLKVDEFVYFDENGDCFDISFQPEYFL